MCEQVTGRLEDMELEDMGLHIGGGLGGGGGGVTFLN